MKRKTYPFYANKDQIWWLSSHCPGNDQKHHLYYSEEITLKDMSVCQFSK